MKRILLIALLFIAAKTNAQTAKPIDSFLGIKFGTPYTEVAEKLKAKGGIIESESATKHDLILYKGLSFNKRKAGYTFVRFDDDKAYSAGFTFTPDPGISVIDLHEQIMQEIAKIYGSSIKTFKKFKEPYEEGDGKELEALNSGNGEFNTYWMDGSNLISETAHKGEVVVLITDGTLAKKAQAKNEAKSDL